MQANIDVEYEDMEKIVSDDVTPATWCEIIREKALRHPNLLVLALMYAQMFSGVNDVVFYLKPLFVVGRKFLNLH